MDSCRDESDCSGTDYKFRDLHVESWQAPTEASKAQRKLSITDWEGDGRFDLLLNSANADLWVQMGEQSGSWVIKRIGPLNDRNIEGHDVSPTTVDFYGDGIRDFLGGAEDGRLYFLKNTRSQ